MPVDLARITEPCNAPFSKEGLTFVNNCDYDGVGAMFKHIIPNQTEKPLVPRDLDWQNWGTISEFDQNEFAEKSAAMDNSGYVFVPHACNSNNSACKVHVAFHGCHQSKNSLEARNMPGSAYAENTGYLEWAGTNEIIVLFPQVLPLYKDLNWIGCWDVWGYTGQDNLTN